MYEERHASTEGQARLRTTDEELLAVARAGDESAFGELIDRHADRLFRLACRMVGSAADAEDVVQETLMGAFEHMGRFGGRSTVRPWLTRILMRQAARCHRRRSRRKSVPFEEAGPDRSLAVGKEQSVSPVDEVGRRLDVEAALRKLSPQHRAVVVLREFEGMSYDEMAAVLRVPQGTVESRLYRARRELKTILRDYMPGS